MGNRKQKGGDFIDFNDFINWLTSLFKPTAEGQTAEGQNNGVGGGKKHKSVKKSKGKKHQKSAKR